MVVVIGAGATGLGTAWDLILRGIPVTVVEAGEPGTGTSGRFHGLLHSGGRYAVVDPVSAKQCREENVIMRQIAPSAIDPVGGYFVSVDDEGKAFADEWVEACRQAGIPVAPVTKNELLQRLPGVSPSLSQGFRVFDAVLKGFELLGLLCSHIIAHGGTILTRTTVTGIEQSDGRVRGVRTRSHGGDARFIPCDAVVNATGPWAGKTAQMFQDDLPMILASGMMIIYSNRMVSFVVNRLAPPGDGDIVVPHGRTTILGTTDVEEAVPDPQSPRRQEAQYLQELGMRLFPDMGRWRALRAFVGVRPLFAGEGMARSRVSRDFTVVDHAKNHGLAGAFSVLGGKWTTYRLMAERTADAVIAYLGEGLSYSLTASTVLNSPRQLPSGGAVLCECESVSALELTAQRDDSTDSWRTKTWFAMGPCQGTFCAHRGIALKIAQQGVDVAIEELGHLRKERERGIRPVAWGDNARQWALNQAITGQTLAEEAFYANRG
jgi:glycerol-3-phosphate dehydrogenase